MPLDFRSVDGGAFALVATLGFALLNNARLLLMSSAATTDDLTGRDDHFFQFTSRIRRAPIIAAVCDGLLVMVE